MDSKEFSFFRNKLDKTQKQLAQLLAVSQRAVKSYQLGSRSIPVHVERQMLFLVSQKNKKPNGYDPCWRIKKCPPMKKKNCPAWEFQSGDLCWFIKGTVCEGYGYKSWKKKMEICRSCEVLTAQLSWT
jgi:hypothetical protein